MASEEQEIQHKLDDSAAEQQQLSDALAAAQQQYEELQQQQAGDKRQVCSVPACSRHHADMNISFGTFLLPHNPSDRYSNFAIAAFDVHLTGSALVDLHASQVQQERERLQSERATAAQAAQREAEQAMQQIRQQHALQQLQQQEMFHEASRLQRWGTLLVAP